MLKCVNAESSADCSDLRGAVALAHHFLSAALRPGDRAVDATCGNGNDTLFLAGLVGPSGQVWGFDIQQDALRNTSALLTEHGLLSRVLLVPEGHENLSAIVGDPVRAVVFNLGFLPGGDRKCITMPETTVKALGQAVGMLQPGGIVTVAIYPGHTGGSDESVAVENWGSTLPPSTFNVWRHRQVNRSIAAPYLMLIERRCS